MRSVPRLVESLYVHVPFCAQKCNYCAFFSEASSGDLINRYVKSLTRELELVAQLVRPKTVFFGGGTPSILNLSQWERIFNALRQLGLDHVPEWTVECNPATVSLDKARLLRDAGVNRISMGVQSLDEALLDRLGRVHSREMVFKSYDILRRAGFQNVNLDLMFAIPGQSLDVWRSTLDEAIALQSEHISSYEVIYEEDTALYAQLQAGEVDVNEDLACEMYDLLVDRVTSAGFHQYEIANFARQQAISDLGDLPSHACRHNVNYWRGRDFYGLGPSATSYVAGQRSKNWSNTQLYCDQLEKGKRAVESSETLSGLARAGETAAFGLRMVRGWGFQEFKEITGFDLRTDWREAMTECERHGWGRLDDHGFRLTREGLRFADAAAELFLR